MFWSIKFDFTRNPIALITVIIFMTGCSGNQPDVKGNLYNIDSLVSSQIKYLTVSGGKLEKTISINGERSNQVVNPKDSLQWENELQIFRELDAVNKPVNRKLYLVDDDLFDPSSNLTVKAFSALEKLPVKYVRVFYQSSINRPRKIEALYDDENPLYKSGRLLTMEFGQIKDQSILTSYSIEGGQKMLVGDSVTFLINGKIIIE